jgi:hypothetical protein
MRVMICSCLSVLLAGSAMAELPELPISDERLTVSSLVREDVFAGWQRNDMKRFARAEENIELLLEQRPKSNAELLAWKGGTRLYRAILAYEDDQTEEFERLYKETLDLHDQARKAGPNDGAVNAVVGGSYVVFGDRLPEKYRDAAWSACYDGYSKLWSGQSKYLTNLPVHIRGELLAGLVQSTQRLGRQDDLDKYLDKMIEVLPDTRYARTAQKWKDDPTVAAGENISCVGCHAEGRLSRRIKKLAKK